jgi:hypothetical protein
MVRLHHGDGSVLPRYARNQVKGLADGEPQGTLIILNLETTLYG